MPDLRSTDGPTSRSLSDRDGLWALLRVPFLNQFTLIV